jgi:LacI family transcriptional regulator
MISPKQDATPTTSNPQRRVRAAGADSAARPTIMDLARRCGVSKATASKAMNMPPELCPVRKSTRERIHQMAQEIGYRPSWRAKALADGKSHTIGLLYSGPFPWYLTGIYGPMMQAFSMSLQQCGYHLLFVPVIEEDDRWSHMLLDQRLDGCVVADHMPEDVKHLLADSKLPVVMLNARSSEPYPSVVPDDRDGGRQVTQHLIDIGHRELVFYAKPVPRNAKPGFDEHFSVSERSAGFEETLRQAKLLSRSEIVRLPIDRFVERLAGGKLKTRPTAILVDSHNVAMELMNLLWQHGVRIPDDVSLATFNDVEPVQFMTPPLTTVSVPVYEIGRQGALLLVRHIQEKKKNASAPITECVTIPETLIVRASTSPPHLRG